MNEAVLLLCLALCALLASRRDYFAPAAVFAYIATLNAVVFYAVGVLGLRFPWLVRKEGAGAWQIGQSYEAVAPNVLLFLLLLTTLGFVAYLVSFCLQPERYGVHHLAATHSNGRERLRNILLSWPVQALLAVLAALAVLHLVQVDFSKIVSHHGVYKRLRDPVFLGVTNSALKLFHSALPMVGVVMGPIMVVALKHRRPVAALLAAMLFGYSAMFMLASDSRFFVLHLMMVAVTFQVLRPKGLSPSAVVMGLMSFVGYMLIIALRVEGQQASPPGPFGLAPAWRMLVSGCFFFLDAPLVFLFNLFCGGFVMAEAFTRIEVIYPLGYKLLSFSPLPSVLDGFDAVKDARVRAAPHAPFSTFAETYHFGWAYFAAYLVIIFAALVVLTRFWLKWCGALAFCVLTPVYYTLAAMHVYALRNPMRWLVLCTLGVLLVEWVVSVRRSRSVRNEPAAAGAAIPLRLRVTFIGVLPPPVTGMTNANRYVLDRLADRADLRIWAASQRRLGRWPWKLNRLFNYIRGGVRMLLWPCEGRDWLYVAANSSWGLWYDLILVILARWRGYRIIMHHHVFNYIEKPFRRIRWINGLMRPSDVHVCLCPIMLGRFEAIYGRRCRMFELPNCIGDASKPLRGAAENRRTNGRLRVGHLSNLSFAKGLDLVLDTFDRLRHDGTEVELALAGPFRSGRERNLFEAVQQRDGEHLEYVGAVYDQQKWRFYENIDVLLFPTRYRNEAQPLVLVEAIYCGVPVIAFGRGCIPTLVGDGGGTLVDPESDFVEAAAPILTRWASDPAALANAQARAARRGAQFQADALTRFDAFFELLSAPDTGPDE